MNNQPIDINDQRYHEYASDDHGEYCILLGVIAAVIWALVIWIIIG